MGWGSGSEIMASLIRVANKHVPEEARIEFYRDTIVALENSDWDTQGDCIGKDPLFDAALKSLHPDWDWIDE